jgi:hypothetical protein
MANSNGTPKDTTVKMWTQGDADAIRYNAVRNGFYPTSDTRSKPDDDYYEENIRQRLLPAILPLLDRNDLICIFRTAEALVEWPVDARFFEHELKRQRANMEWLVESGQLGKRALEVFDEVHPEAAGK